MILVYRGLILSVIFLFAIQRCNLLYIYIYLCALYIYIYIYTHTHTHTYIWLKEGVSLAACCSKANKQARLVERRFCFISDVSNFGGEGQHVCPKVSCPSHPATGNQWGKSFYSQKGGGSYIQKQLSQLWQSYSNWLLVVWPASSWLF